MKTNAQSIMILTGFGHFMCHFSMPVFPAVLPVEVIFLRKPTLRGMRRQT